jgi:hypothetical protein
MLDTSKQVIGQCSQHISNLILAENLGEDSGLECEWYLNNLMADCTLGVFFQFIYLYTLLYILKGSKFEFATGNYGQKLKDFDNSLEDNEWCDFKFSKYFYQLFWWLIIVLLSKLTVLGILLIFYKFVENVGKLILSPIKSNPKIKLVVVMIILPTLFNIIQLWFTDNFIKIQTDVKENIDENNKNKIDGSEVIQQGYTQIPTNDLEKNNKHI